MKHGGGCPGERPRRPGDGQVDVLVPVQRLLDQQARRPPGAAQALGLEEEAELGQDGTVDRGSMLRDDPGHVLELEPQVAVEIQHGLQQSQVEIGRGAAERLGVGQGGVLEVEGEAGDHGQLQEAEAVAEEALVDARLSGPREQLELAPARGRLGLRGVMAEVVQRPLARVDDPVPGEQRVAVLAHDLCALAQGHVLEPRPLHEVLDRLMHHLGVGPDHLDQAARAHPQARLDFSLAQAVQLPQPLARFRDGAGSRTLEDGQQAPMVHGAALSGQRLEDDVGIPSQVLRYPTDDGHVVVVQLLGKRVDLATQRGPQASLVDGLVIRRHLGEIFQDQLHPEEDALGPLDQNGDELVQLSGRREVVVDIREAVLPYVPLRVVVHLEAGEAAEVVGERLPRAAGAADLDARHSELPLAEILEKRRDELGAAVVLVHRIQEEGDVQLRGCLTQHVEKYLFKRAPRPGIGLDGVPDLLPPLLSSPDEIDLVVDPISEGDATPPKQPLHLPRQAGPLPPPVDQLDKILVFIQA